MLQITIQGKENFDESNQTFIYTKEQTLQLEHSLISLSKWESKWLKPFLGKEQKTIEESIDYIRCMTTTQNVDALNYKSITQQIIDEVNTYIEAPMTATWFKENKRHRANEMVTAEIIYYWMIALNIPFECQKWHLNRLLTLVQVCNIKNGPQKKMSKKEILSQNRSLNETRKQNLQTSG